MLLAKDSIRREPGISARLADPAVLLARALMAYIFVVEGYGKQRLLVSSNHKLSAVAGLCERDRVLQGCRLRSSGPAALHGDGAG